MTQGDVIRAMTDEELAELFMYVISERDHYWVERLSDIGMAVDLIEMPQVSVRNHLEWLREEIP